MGLAMGSGLVKKNRLCLRLFAFPKGVVLL